MKLIELQQILGTSERSSWNLVADRGAPGLMPEYDFVSKGPELLSLAATRSHAYVASYRPDVSFTMAWGMSPSLLQDSFTPDGWGRFADHEVEAFALDLMWQGMLVDRQYFVLVDGGRCYLPLPLEHFDGGPMDTTKLGVTTTQWHVNVARLLNDLSRPGQAHDFDSYVERSGIIVDPEDSPPGS